MDDNQLFMVFDVESVGLHGEAFWVGWVVIDRSGREHESREFRCVPDSTFGTAEGMAWVRENCPEALDRDTRTHVGPSQVADAFWEAWVAWKAHGAMLAADCPWPVEARFLIEAVEDVFPAREWQGPYPLIDVASVRLAAGFDPLGTVDRLPGEFPAHDPIADARQSARLLIEALDSIAGKAVGH